MLSLRSRMSESYIYEAVKYSPKASAALFKGMDALENTAESYMEFGLCFIPSVYRNGE